MIDEDDDEAADAPSETPLFKQLPDGRYVCWDPAAQTYCVVAPEFVPPLVLLHPPPTSASEAKRLWDASDEPMMVPKHSD